MNEILITVADDPLGAALSRQLARLLAERGHRACLLNDAELTNLDDTALRARLVGVANVIHLSEAQPPLTDCDQFAGYRRNVLATRRLIAACLAQPTPPRLTLRSAVAVCGALTGLGDAPPLATDAAAQPVDSYGRQKAECEVLLRDSGLEFTIFRLAMIPAPAYAEFTFAPHPDTRIEPTDPAELALAFANAIDSRGVLGRTLLLGGGPARRQRYRTRLNRMLAARGVADLPPEAFGSAHHLSDWLDTRESQALLGYQRGFAVAPYDSLPRHRGLLLAYSRALAAAGGRRARLAELRAQLALLRRALSAGGAFLRRTGN